jgi:hypothetical protein
MSTKFGLHVAQGSRNGYGDVVAAAPAVVLAVAEGGALVEAHEKSGGRTITIFREQTVFHDAPPRIDHMSEAEATAAADHYWPQLLEKYRLNPADYYQPVNETGGDNETSLRNIIAFERRLLELAERDGLKLAVGSPAGGSPGSWDLWQRFYVPLIRRAGEGGHIYSRHAYGGVVPGSSGLLSSAAGPGGAAPADDNAGRPFREAQFLREQGILTPMVITEAGPHAGFRFPGAGVFMEDMARYDQLCRHQDNIWGFCAWTYGNYQNFPANIQDASALMADYLRQQGGATRPTYPAPVLITPGPDTEPATGTTVPAEAASHAYEFVRFENSANDYTNVQPGRQFTASWTVRNSGSGPWLGDFQLAYAEQHVAQTEGQALSPLGAPPVLTLRQLAGRDAVRTGATITLTLNLTAPLQPGWFASHWQLRTASGAVIGRPLWLHLNVKGAVAPPVAPPGEPVVVPPIAPPASTTAFQPGMNINPDVHPPDVERLRGLTWVRFPYKAAAKHRNVDEAYHGEYAALIQSYAHAGIKSLIILNQETEWGNAPWHNGDWQAYAGAFANAARRIAELVSPFRDQVAYQIWNEGDSDPSNPSAIGVSAEDFAPVLQQTAAAIRAVDSQATIVLGGLNTGPENAVAYARRVQQLLGGSLPVDALAYHPYGRYVEFDPFYGQQFGKLGDALRLFQHAFPTLPLWITEMGVANDTPIGPEHYEKIARYMREITGEVARHARHVPVLIWFAWSDHMRNAGITTTSGELKPHIGEAFQAMVRQAQPAPVFAAGPPQANAEFVSFQTTLADHNAVPAGATFTNSWRFRNSGATTWGDGYRLVYVPGGAGVQSDPMTPQKSYPLAEVASPLPVAPGKETVITLSLAAPQLSGRVYQSRWQLRDGAGKTFGHLYAEITVVPASPVGSGAQQAGMEYIADHTIPDDTRLPEGQSFLKQWRVRNSGARQWGSGFRLVFVEGDLQMAAGIASHVVPTARRGDEVVLTVPMVAPMARDNRPTTYSSLWRLQDDRGDFFGAPIWARIVSQPAAVVTPLGRFADASGWYSQLDPQWANVLLGAGQQNIGAWGCLLTCHAMMLSAYGLRVTPADLNRRFSQLGEEGFRGSDVQFNAPPRLLPGLRLGRNLRSWPTPELPWTEWTGEDPIARIDKAIADGYTVLAQVDRTPNNAFYHSNTEQHWVILVARTPDGADYLMLDPITPSGQLANQPLSLMRKYGNPAPSRPHEENLRHAIKSALIYLYNGPA